MDIVTYALSKKYTDKTSDSLGSLKGAPATIKSITKTDKQNDVLFEWTGNSGAKDTRHMYVLDGEDGFSPIVTLTEVTGGVEISVEDEEGNIQTATVENGKGDTVEVGTTTTVDSDQPAEVEAVPTSTGIKLNFKIPKGPKGDSGSGGGGDAVLEHDVKSNTAAGAIPSGTTIPKDTTFTQFVEKLLISEVAPTISFSITKSGNVAYGGSYNETLTVNVSNMGSAKSIDTIAWYKGNTLLKTDTIGSTTTGSWTYTVADAVTDTATFKAIVTYKKSDNTQATTTKSASITFYYNKFYGSVASLTPSEADVEALTSVLGTAKGGSYVYNVSAARIAYAYPKSLGALTSIKDGNGFSLFDSFTRTEVTYTQNSTSVAYYLYVLTDETTVSSYTVVYA